MPADLRWATLGRLPMIDPSIERELDAAHASAQEAYRNRDIVAYMERLTPGVSYRETSGRVVSREKLTQQVLSQFRRLSAAATSFTRVGLRTAPHGVEEDLVQEVWACGTGFAFIHRVWHLERKGTYTWSNADGEWRISAVTVHSERVVLAVWRFGRRPALPLGVA